MAKGDASEDAYPYSSSGGSSGKCDSSAQTKADGIAKGLISGYKDVTPNSESALQQAVAGQPVSVAIEADQSVFQFYSSGVLSSSSCGTDLDHGVLVVGYGTD